MLKSGKNKRRKILESETFFSNSTFFITILLKRKPKQPAKFKQAVIPSITLDCQPAFFLNTGWHLSGSSMNEQSNLENYMSPDPRQHNFSAGRLRISVSWGEGKLSPPHPHIGWEDGSNREKHDDRHFGQKTCKCLRDRKLPRDSFLHRSTLHGYLC